MKFTDEQLAVINSDDAVSVVQAGPGTGKTTTIGGKIARHLREKRSGYDFLAITFSRYGARQIQDAVSKLDPTENWKIDTNTFHGFALDIINRFTGKNWHVIDEEDMTYILDDNGWWSNAVSFKDYLKGKSVSPTERRMCAEEYDRISSGYNWMTYDQMLVKLLNDKRALGWIKDRYSYLFVDEAQDMTPTQLALVKAMDIEHTMYVGDVNQAIYEWNGASPKILMELSNAHKVYPLTKNWRSGSAIVEASNNLITHNSMRIPNANISATETEGEVRVWKTSREDYLDKLEECISGRLNDGAKPSDIVILSRYNQEVAEILNREWGDIPMSRTLASASVRSMPMFRLFVAGARLRQDKTKVHWALLLKELNLYQNIEPTKNKWMFAESMQHFINLCPEWLFEAVEEESFYKYIERYRDMLGPAEFNPERTLFEMMMDTYEKTTLPKLELDFLKWFATFGVQDIQDVEEQNVRVMTMHQAKGLEFERVITIEPKYKGADEENRRVVFVAWTRAMESLDVFTKGHEEYATEGQII